MRDKRLKLVASSMIQLSIPIYLWYLGYNMLGYAFMIAVLVKDINNLRKELK